MFTPSLELCLVIQIEHKELDKSLQFLQRAIQGGVSLVQLRDKKSSPKILKTTALILKSFLNELNIPLIINDYVNLAQEIEADGVHLGQNDLSPITARKILGQDKIIGWSVESYEDLMRANQLDCIDYIGVSSVFESRTKLDCKTIWGLEGLKKVCALSKHPSVAIGGIELNNASAVMRQGVCGLAVVSALTQHLDPFNAAVDLKQEIQAGKKQCLQKSALV